jgi:predicted enzyme related to lactoylglutathione lyase
MIDHKIVHIEFAAKDRKSLSKFYANVFGWEVEHIDQMDYTTFKAGDGLGGGFNPVNETTHPGTTTVYIATDDVTESLKAVEKAGGIIVVPESEIPNMGKFGLFQDPQGNLVGLYKAYPMPAQM